MQAIASESLPIRAALFQIAVFPSIVDLARIRLTELALCVSVSSFLL
jgi:hypothetical protein